MQYTKDDINKYIESKQLAWSPTTIKSEQARLHAALDLINQGAEQLYHEGLKRYSPYALKTLMIRVSAFADFMGSTDANPFRSFLKTNARLFKNAYIKEDVDVDYAEACKLVEGMEDGAARMAAQLILQTGLRSTEALQYDGSGFIIGKGSKLRPVMSEQAIPNEARADLTYSKLHKALAKVGLKPHTLRKLVATQLVDAGISEMDLLKIMGWSNIATAASYLQSRTNKELEIFMKGALQNGN